jgi:hypothetical protein
MASDVSYADRPLTTHTDGTPLHQIPSDLKNEERVADVLGMAWECELHRFGILAPIDFYATREGRMAGVIEIKCRSHESTKFRTVFLNVRKWLALGLAQTGLGVPAIFAVDFTDGLRFISWADVDGRNIRIAGCERRVKSNADIEPIILVPLSRMKLVVNREGERA